MLNFELVWEKCCQKSQFTHLQVSPDVAMGGGYSGIVQMGTSNPSSPRINPPPLNWKFSWMT